jgi:enoyl-CoA hydratase/carnithine racemase
MADDLVLCTVEAGVALLTLNRPERKNAWTISMEEQYFDLLRA